MRWPADTSRSIYDVKNERDDSAAPGQSDINPPFISSSSSSSSFFFFNDLFITSVEVSLEMLLDL